jgi:predicted polyphosphate/ATP-dependent NAD kinase
MHSAVYATTPRAAGEVAVRFLNEEETHERLAHCREAEVMDIDEEAVRAGRVSARLYGYLRVPVAPSLVQRVKAGRGGGEAGELAAIAAEVVDRMADGRLYLLGPGTTTRAIADRLGIPKTLLGVDVVYRGELVARDVSEREILDHLGAEHVTPLSHAAREAPGEGPGEMAVAKVVVTPIGGQGYLFGRGNQQLSSEVIRRVGRANILVVAAAGKLAALGGEPFLVDTGDPDVDALLAGHLRVVTGYRTEAVYRVAG